jgi:hypothetical protein
MVNILRGTVRPAVCHMPRAPIQTDVAGLHSLGYDFADGAHVATIMGLRTTRLAAFADQEYVYHGVRAEMAGTTTNGNKVISGLPSTTGLAVGMAISGTGVGAASVIASIDSSTQVTGTVNSTASAAVAIVFTK